MRFGSFVLPSLEPTVFALARYGLLYFYLVLSSPIVVVPMAETCWFISALIYLAWVLYLPALKVEFYFYLIGVLLPSLFCTLTF